MKQYFFVLTTKEVLGAHERTIELFDNIRVVQTTSIVDEAGIYCISVYCTEEEFKTLLGALNETEKMFECDFK